MIKAEFLKTHATFTWYGSLFTLIASIYAWMMAAGSGVDAPGWNSGVVVWLNFYPVALALPIGALIGAVTQFREVKLRAGGTAWRAYSEPKQRLARILVLTSWAAWCQLLLVVPLVIVGICRGQGVGPWERLLVFAGVMWLSVTTACIFGMLAVLVLGRIAVGVAPLGALVWSMAGALVAETASWQWQPYSWLVRATIPLLGAHANGLALAADSPLWQQSVWQPVAGNLLICIALLVAAVLIPTVSFSPQLGAYNAPAQRIAKSVHLWQFPSHSTSDKQRVLAALAATLPWRLWGTVTGFLVLLLLLIKSVYPTSYVAAMLVFVAVPSFAVLVGVMAWTRNQAAWRQLLLRVSATRLHLALVVLIALAFCCADSMMWLAAGGALLQQPQLLVVFPVLSVLIAGSCFFLAAQFTMALSLMFATGALIGGLLVCGNEIFMDTLFWWTAPWGWANIVVYYPQRWFAVVLASIVLSTLVFTAAIVLAPRAALR